MARKARGVFITFEGPEGSGKTTLAKAIGRDLRRQGWSVLLTEEPGGCSLGKFLRKILLDPRHHRVNPLAELFLFEADRAQHVDEVIRPALKRGQVVLCCRFSDSTTAYQGYGRKVDLKWVKSLNRRASGALTPDLTLLLDLSPRLGLPRAFRARGDRDRMESESLDFHRRLRRGFLALAKKDERRIKVIDASDDFERVKEKARSFIQALL